MESLLISAYRGKKTDRAPCWFMRQAGRYLPEYQEIRAKHSMLDCIRTPELAAKITLQPIERFEPDGAIIFADILNPLIGMGIELDFVQGQGPQIFNPVSTPEDVARLKVPEAKENVPYTLEAIDIVSSALRPKGIPLLGFAGAPFTLSSYMIEGKGSQSLSKVKKFMFTHPESWKSLQEKLSDMIGSYLLAQVKAGASAVQIFDSWLGFLAPVEYDAFVAPYLKKIIQSFRAEADVPIIFFATSTTGLFEKFQSLGATALGVDWRISLNQADRLLGGKLPLQGNLDPLILASAPLDYLEKRVLDILKEGSAIGSHVFNLGHGILPHTPPENVGKVVEIVKSYRKTT